MESIIITYKYSNRDKQHEYGLLINIPSPVYENWIWFGIGQIMLKKPKFLLYPYSIDGKIIYKADIDMFKTSADVVGRRIAKKILHHYSKIK